MKVLIVLASIAALALSAGPVNKECPVAKKPIKEGVVSKIKDKKGADAELGFCCGNCKGKFDNADEAGKKKILDEVKELKDAK